MKFVLPAIDYDYLVGRVDGTINGGTVWLHNICLALRFHGHEADVIPLTDHYEADYIIIQSEWLGMPNVQDFYNRGGKIITLLGHFISHVYPNIGLVRNLSHRMVTMWEGELLEGFDTLFMPHGYSDLLDDGCSISRRGEIVWAGNPYQLRDEGYFAGLDVTLIRGTYPKELFGIYRGANVCPNLHGDFQKGVVSTQPSRIADRPGQMLNERFWNVLGCGGVMVTDFVPQMLKWFTEDELIIGKTKEEFQELVKYYAAHPEEGREKLAQAREKVIKEHTYKERVKVILNNI
jgi:hypothetical protein